MVHFILSSIINMDNNLRRERTPSPLPQLHLSQSLLDVTPLSSLDSPFIDGSIIPRQVPGITTTASRANSFEALVVPDFSNSATGILRWDDGESIPQGDVSSSDYWNIRYDYSVGNFTVSVSKTVSYFSICLQFLGFCVPTNIGHN